MHMGWLHVLIVAGSGAVVGVLGAILGTGGGVFLIPILVLGLDVPMHQAVATSILTVVATSSAVASTNVERGLANMRLGMTLEIATSLGAIATGKSITDVSIVRDSFGSVWVLYGDTTATWLERRVCP